MVSTQALVICVSRIRIISRVPDQNGISQACFIVEIYHSGPEPSICKAVQSEQKKMLHGTWLAGPLARAEFA